MSDTVIIISSALEALGFTKNNHKKHKSARIASNSMGFRSTELPRKNGASKAPLSFLGPHPIFRTRKTLTIPVLSFSLLLNPTVMLAA